MFPLFKNGTKTFKNSVFLLRFVENGDFKSRFAFSVSKKISKDAVVRNRLRRIGYRLLSPFVSKSKENVLALFLYSKLPKDENEILVSLESILNQAQLIK